MYHKVVAKVNNIDISGFDLKTKYDTDKSDLGKKIPNVSGIVKKTDYNAEISEPERKIPSISCLITNSALTAVEKEISDVSNLVRKQIMMEKNQELKVNISLKLIIIKLLKILLLIR